MGATLSGLSQETLQDRYGHDLLEHWDDEWVAPQRALLREWRLRSLEALSTQATADGDGGLAIQAALMVLEADPYRETAIRKVIDACLQDGNRALAVLHYGVFAERLYADIGVPPVNDLAAAIPGVSSSVIRRQLPARG
jgi:DNA-binding SARP family transcriptional activator